MMHWLKELPLPCTLMLLCMLQHTVFSILCLLSICRLPSQGIVGVLGVSQCLLQSVMTSLRRYVTSPAPPLSQLKSVQAPFEVS